MKSTYAKLDSRIVYSSMWGEDAVTCKVWVTLLALKDMDGIVTQNVTGIARVSNLPLKEVNGIIEKFLLPDPESTTKTDEGRRLRKIEGVGFEVVNHNLYKELGWSEDKKEFERKRKAEYRARMAGGVVKPGALALVGMPAAPGVAPVVIKGPKTPPDRTDRTDRTDRSEVQTEQQPEVLARFLALKSRLVGYYQREPEAPWDYLEDYSLLEIAKRPSCRTELDEIFNHAKKLPADRKPFFPMASVSKLFEGWTKLLDTARMAAGNQRPVDPAGEAGARELYEKMVPGLKGLTDQFRVGHGTTRTETPAP